MLQGKPVNKKPLAMRTTVSDKKKGAKKDGSAMFKKLVRGAKEIE
jgi:hypothetical protein